jgi:predicted MPP superfamily phosphohydrolase
MTSASITPHETECDFAALQVRLGAGHTRRRLIRQTTHIARMFGGGRARFHVENMIWLHHLLAVVLRLTGLYRRAWLNAMRPVVRCRAVRIKGLPAAFDGFRLLHLSDLHCDADAAFVPEVIQRLAGVEYDACMMTGDFRLQTFGSYAQAIGGMRKLKAALATPAYAVLGNHDYLEMTADLEAMGIRVLLNEAVPIERRGARIWIAGVDDAHYYETADIERASRDIPPGETAILLAHSADVYPDAAKKGFALMLCGHTHGGQMCLPGGVMVIKNSRCRRRFCRGAWQHGELAGYTSSGTGSSGLAVRLNCPPEIVVHRLEKDG